MAEQLLPVAGGEHGAAQDGDAADDLDGAGHGAQQDEAEQHGPSGVGDVQGHALGGADGGNALVVEEIGGSAGQGREGHDAHAEGGQGAPGEGPGAEEGKHYEEVCLQQAVL